MQVVDVLNALTRFPGRSEIWLDDSNNVLVIQEPGSTNKVLACSLSRLPKPMLLDRT